MNLYNVLGVDEKASTNEIKKAYLKLAKTSHPDRGGDAEEFKQINKAYTILMDDNKRSFYDMTGQVPGEEGRPEVHEVHFGGAAAGGPAGMPFPFHFDIGQMFGMFGANMRPGGPGDSQSRRKGPKGPNKIDRLPLSLEQFYYGHSIKLSFDRMKLCGACNGTGAANTADCGSCRGRGQIHKVIQMGQMIMNSSGPCPDCNGKGQKVSKECGPCKGKGRVPENRQLDVQIAPGMTPGEQLTFEGACSETAEYDAPGDVVIILEEAESAAGWTRKGADLYFDAGLKLGKSLVGCNVRLTDHPKVREGESDIFVYVAGPVIGGDVLRVKGLGMPVKGAPGSFGDLYMTVKIFPDEEERNKIAQEGRAFLASLLGVVQEAAAAAVAEVV
jgi:DnaJ-class molecular chaperone